jgi:hypothetical protein
MKIYLKILNGPDQGRDLATDIFPATIGGAETNIVPVNDILANSYAGEIISLRDEFYLRPAPGNGDLRLNGRIIENMTQVASGDVLRLGGTLILIGILHPQTTFRPAVGA